MTTEEILGRLQGVRRAGDGKWSARCPAHDDKKPSLSVSTGRDGRTLLRCHADGCKTDDIVEAIGLRIGDLFPEQPRDAASAKKIVATYDYTDEQGALLYQVVRFEPKDFRQRRPDGKGGWDWSLRDVRRVPYRLPQLLAAAPDVPVFIVEGEKDADNLAARGLVATCNAGGAGANKWSQVADAARMALKGRQVIVLGDNDDPGREHARAVAESLRDVVQVRLVDLPGLPPKGEVSDWLAAGGTAGQLLALAESAPEPASAPEPPSAPPPYHRAPALVDVILERATEPWVSLGLDGAEVTRLRLGGLGMVMGSSGSGKSTLVAALLAEHARLHGPAIYVTLELDADELAARVVGMNTASSWEDVLRGAVGREAMLAALPPRLVVVDGTAGALDRAEVAIADMRAAHPGEPMLVAVDYIQLASAGGPELRAQTAAVAERLRALAKRDRVVMLGVSQTSRAAGRALRAGEVLGAESATTGAESSAIERAAYVTLALGAMGEADGAGVCTVDVSVGKARFGGGDRVIPMAYNGRTGLWRVAGEARRAADVAAERQAEKDERQADSRRTAAAARDDERVAAALQRQPSTARQLRAATSMSGAKVADALERLQAAGRVVAEESLGDARGARQAVRIYRATEVGHEAGQVGLEAGQTGCGRRDGTPYKASRVPPPRPDAPGEAVPPEAVPPRKNGDAGESWPHGIDRGWT